MKTTSLTVFILLTIFAVSPSVLRSQPLPGEEDADSKRQRVNEILNAAFEAYVDERYDAAIVNFEKVLQFDSEDKTALQGLKQSRKKISKKMKSSSKKEQKNIRRVRKLIRKEKWLNAMDLLSETLSRAPGHREALDIRRQLSALFTQKMTAVPARPGNPLIYQGMIYYLNEQYESASDTWNDAVSLRPDDFKLSIYIERAEELFKESARYELLTSGRDRAKDAFVAGNYQEAMEIWKKILEYDPDDGEARQEYKAALDMYDKGRRKNLIGDYYDNGLALFNEAKYVESLKEWKSILAIDSDNEVAKKYIQRIKKKGFDVEDPVEEAEEAESPAAVTPEPESGSTSDHEPAEAGPETYTKGLTLYKQENYPDALIFFENLFVKNPDDAKAKVWLARIREEQKRKAEKRYQKGLVSYSQDKVYEAITEWQEVLKIDPDHTATLRILEKVSEGKEK